MGRVTIVIVSWNSREWLGRCLSSLAGTPHTVVVVDNGSTDGSADLVAAAFPGVRLLRERENLGFAGAVNRAAADSHADFLLLLNSDTEAEPGSVDTLARVLAADARIGAAGGSLHDARGQPQRGFQVRRFPTVASWAVDLLLLDKLWPGNPVTRRYHAMDLDETRPSEVEQPAAACLMVRRAAFDRIGGMDERFWPAWFEDVDLCKRLLADGWRILFVPDAVFGHRGGVAMDALGLAAFSRIFYRNLLRYAGKHHSAPARAGVRLLLCAGMLLRVGISALRLDWRGARAYGAVLGDAVGLTREARPMPATTASRPRG